MAQPSSPMASAHRSSRNLKPDRRNEPKMIKWPM